MAKSYRINPIVAKVEDAADPRRQGWSGAYRESLTTKEMQYRPAKSGKGKKNTNSETLNLIVDQIEYRHVFTASFVIISYAGLRSLYEHEQCWDS